MASFTDTPHTFNPYVKTLPVDAYTKVGMYKQQKYDEGLVKVQAAFDAQAALPIDKTSVKEYLNNKLSEIKKSLGENISGDFSDQRVINQVGAATSKISSDPYIMNGVTGTALGRAGIAAANEDEKTSKGANVENRAVFQHEYDKWLNDDNASTPANFGKYHTYVDVIGSDRDALKDMGDSTYETSGDPNSQDAVILKGKSAKRIGELLALNHSRPEIQQQIAIEAKYKYMNYPEASLTQDIENHFQAQTALWQKGIDDETLAMNNITSADPAVSNPNIEYYNKLKEKEIINRDAYLKNPESFKYDSIEQGISNKFTSAYVTGILETDPNWTAKIEMAKMEMAAREKAAAAAAKATEAAGKGIQVITQPGKHSEDAGKRDASTFTLSVDQISVDADQERKKVIHNYYINNDVNKTKDGAPPPIISVDGKYVFNNAGYRNYKNAAGKSVTAEEAYNEIYTKLRATTIGPGAKASSLEMWAESDRLNKIEMLALGKQGQMRDKGNAIADEFVKDITGRTVINGVTVDLNYTPEEVDRMSTFTKAYIVRNKLGDWQQTEQELNDKYHGNWQQKAGVDAGGSRGSMYAGISGRTGDYAKFAKEHGDDIEARYKDLNTEYQDMQRSYAPMSTTFLANTAAEKEEMRQTFSGMAEIVGKDTGQTASFRAFVKGTAKGDNTSNNVYGARYDRFTNKYYWTISAGGTITPAEMEVNKEQFESIPKLKANNDFERYFGPQLAMTKNTTTDVPSKAWPNGMGVYSAIPVITPDSNIYEVLYHVTGDGTDENFGMKLYIYTKPHKDKNGNMVPRQEMANGVNSGIKTNKAGILAATQTLANDASVEEFLKRYLK